MNPRNLLERPILKKSLVREIKFIICFLHEAEAKAGSEFLSGRIKHLRHGLIMFLGPNSLTTLADTTQFLSEGTNHQPPTTNDRTHQVHQELSAWRGQQAVYHQVY